MVKALQRSQKGRRASRWQVKGEREADGDHGWLIREEALVQWCGLGSVRNGWDRRRGRQAHILPGLSRLIHNRAYLLILPIQNPLMTYFVRICIILAGSILHQ